ncbi:GTP pyrophosphokinase family protein [Candidatus Saccharibacteria bacterium]|nr:GTP pyrophosphokinase family protein [Candidatus Saccharibacteria bacterium]
MCEVDLKELKAQYEEYIIPEYEAAVRLTKARIENINKILKKKWGYGLDEDQIKSRTKSFDATIKKWDRKKYPGDLSIAGIRQYVTDIAGIRIITDFEDEIYDVVDVLRKVPSINIIEECDYVENKKKSGYQSYHIIAMIEIYSPITEGSKLVPVEIQIRDWTMDAWARIEHKLKYKKAYNEEDDFFTISAGQLNDFRKSAVEKKNNLKSSEKNPAE